MTDMIELDDLELEPEGTPDEPQKDAVFLMGGRGKLVELVVDDDVGDD